MNKLFKNLRAMNFSESDSESQSPLDSIKVDVSKLKINDISGALLSNTFTKYKDDLVSLLESALDSDLSIIEGKINFKLEAIDEITYLETIAKLNQSKWRGLGSYLFFTELGSNYTFDEVTSTVTYEWIISA